MRKTLVIALREYRAAVRSKAFVITLVVMPVLMAGTIVAQLLLKDNVDTSDKRIAILDRSGQLREAISREVAQYNETGVFSGEGDQKMKVKPKFVVEFIDPKRWAESQAALELSRRVRNKEIQGYLIVGSDVLDGVLPAQQDSISYHSLNPVDNAFRRWVEPIVNREIQRIRCEKEGMDPAMVGRLTRHVDIRDRKLVERDKTTGDISKAEDADVMAHIFLPMGLMMLVFMSVMVGATPLMQAVMEEKQARISEVLLGSVRPFQLMLGKLTGIVAVTLTTVLVYIAGAFFTLDRLGHGDLFPPVSIVLWLLLFQTLAVLMYGALFVAIGAAVSDMREAQSAMMPVMLCAMAPMFVWFYVVKEPASTISVALSLFPPATPMLMLLRLSVPPGVPAWQLILGCTLVILSTISCVYAAGRIFRVGILVQGKGASYRRMLSWVLRG